MIERLFCKNFHVNKLEIKPPWQELGYKGSLTWKGASKRRK